MGTFIACVAIIIIISMTVYYFIILFPQIDKDQDLINALVIFFCSCKTPPHCLIRFSQNPLRDYRFSHILQIMHTQKNIFWTQNY